MKYIMNMYPFLLLAGWFSFGRGFIFNRVPSSLNYGSSFLTSDKGMSALNPVFSKWSCIGIKSDIEKVSGAFPFQIGDLPMIGWKNVTGGQYLARVNICNHMGSTLNSACVTGEGRLKCQYHGLEFGSCDTMGTIVESQGKLFWSYEPEAAGSIPGLPSYDDADYDTMTFEYEMPCSLPDAAYNSMDLHHPAYVHRSLFGFGSPIPPTNIKSHYFEGDNYKAGLSFDYISEGLSAAVKNSKETNNYHEYIFPTFTWSRVSFQRTDNKEFPASTLTLHESIKNANKNHLEIGVHFLPVGLKRTKWFVTVAQNYVKSVWKKPLVMSMALSILSQDYVQMEKQAPENALKRDLMFQRLIDNEEVLAKMRPWFEKEYRYPDLEDSRDLIAFHSNNKNKAD